MKFISFVCFITLCLLYLIFLRNPGIFQGIIAIIIILIVNNELLYIWMRNAELRLLLQMSEYITDIRHFYYKYQAIDYAVLDANNKAKKEMRSHGNIIYEILTSDHIEKEVRKYNENSNFDYLKLFLSMCIQVITHGDEEWEGQSLFLQNIHHLKSEIQVEELKQKKLKYLFSGLIFMTVSPLLALDMCKSFGLSNLPELADFYYGVLGITIYLTSILLSLLCYALQNHHRDSLRLPSQSNIVLLLLSNRNLVKKIINRYTENNYTKMLRLKKLLDETKSSLSYPQFLIKSCLYGVISFLLFFVFLQYIKFLQLKYGTDITNVSYLVSFLWYELILLLVLSFLTSKIPLIFLYYQKKLKKQKVENEVKQFQSIVLMVMYFERISVITILEMIEVYADIFKVAIQKCINDFNSGSEQALYKLKEGQDNILFQRFVDNLIVSDKIGIVKAFDEIAADRLYFMERRKQENEILLKNKQDTATLIAYVPLTFILVFYLILPFMIQSYRDYISITSEMF